MGVDFFMHEHEQNIYDTLEADEPVFEEKEEPVNDGTTDDLYPVFVDEKESDITLPSLSAQVENILDCSSMRSSYCRFNMKNEILHKTEEGNEGTEEVHREVEVVKQVLDSVIDSVVIAVAINRKRSRTEEEKICKNAEKHLLLSPCSCIDKCILLIDDHPRTTIHGEFWNLPRQAAWVIGTVTASKPNQINQKVLPHR